MNAGSSLTTSATRSAAPDVEAAQGVLGAAHLALHVGVGQLLVAALDGERGRRRPPSRWRSSSQAAAL